MVEITEAMAEAKWQSDAQHKDHMDEMMSGVRAMLEGIRPLLPSSLTSQVVKMLHLI